MSGHGVLRWGVLSTARIGVRKVIPAIQRADRCEVVAIASRDRARADEVAGRFGIPRAHGSYEDLLADDEVDAVYVPLPNHLHGEWAIAAARAGKHVLCEKPLAMHAAEAQAMIDACATAGVRLMEAFMYRLHPSWEAVRELVAGGKIGALGAVQTRFSYFNDDPANIRNIREAGGGALMDIGCYAVDASRMLFGAEPDSVQASVTRDAGSGVDILTSAILRFGDGVATFTCATQLEPDQHVHVSGERGRISVGIPFNIPPDLPTEVTVTAGGEPPVAPASEVLTFEPADQYEIQAARFARAVLEDEPVPIPPEDAVANMRVLDRIVEAAEGGSR
ncbi:MAG: Gfo/Idh/MocA family protein [Actinomycetota bacterium]